mmetsp:Transcript_12540/g.12612  ORF Transcript_12540/g.12612 Transcript_12540/m.12612 type:complete len:214 (+) Transcript_12540:81-722(+)
MLLILNPVCLSKFSKLSSVLSLAFPKNIIFTSKNLWSFLFGSELFKTMSMIYNLFPISNALLQLVKIFRQSSSFQSCRTCLMVKVSKPRGIVTKKFPEKKLILFPNPRLWINSSLLALFSSLSRFPPVIWGFALTSSQISPPSPPPTSKTLEADVKSIAWTISLIFPWVTMVIASWKSFNKSGFSAASTNTDSQDSSLCWGSFIVDTFCANFL